MSFETDNQDKRNLVGMVADEYDSGLLSDFGGGDVEWWQDYIRSEVAAANEFHMDQDNSKVMSDAVDVEQELIRLKDENRELKEKAKAWDNLEALVAGNTCYVEIGNNSLSVERFYVDDPYIRYEDVTDLKEAVSSAIESIRGES